MIKVLLVSPYSETLVGGIINWTRYIVNYHRDNGRDVEIRLLNNTHANQVMAGANPVKRLIAGFKNYLPVIREFKDTTGKEHFDVVHICTSASFGLIRDLLLVNAAKKKRVKICVHMHFGRIPQILKSSGWEKWLMVRLFNRVDRIVVMDMSSFNALKNNGFDKTVYLPNPLSGEVINLVEKFGNLKREPRKIVYAGHVTDNKGVFELVKACSQVYQIKLDILGKCTTTEIKDSLYEVAGNKERNWLEIPGNKPFEEIIKEMMTCAMFVLPSYSEGFPNVILESMACGCPIIATPVGAIPEMLDVGSDKPCGLCVPIKDVDALKNAIVELIGNPVKAVELGQNARQRVYEQYTMPKVWEKLVGIWQSTVINS